MTTTLSYRTDAASAPDGTEISYRQLGDGPGLVILHGAMSSAYNHMELAEALASHFTVFVVDRRGRGLSGAYSPDAGLPEEAEDLIAVLRKTQAPYALGVSSGAIILLNAAPQIATLTRLCIFEPPLVSDAPTARAALARLNSELAAGDLTGALVTGMLSAKMGPRVFQCLPRWMLKAMLRGAVRHEPPTTAAGYVAMRDLAPLLRYDFNVVVEMADRFEEFRSLATMTLLLGGSKSPRYLRDALTRLAQILPQTRVQMLPGADHAVCWNKDRGGKPEAVAATLRAFFA